MSKWDKVHAILDREVEREVKRVLGKIKAVVGGRGNGNGHTKPIEAKRKRLSRVDRAFVKSAKDYNPLKKKPSKQRMLHGEVPGAYPDVAEGAEGEVERGLQVSGRPGGSGDGEEVSRFGVIDS